jgi:Family of unknown function (DUF5906)
MTHDLNLLLHVSYAHRMPNFETSDHSTATHNGLEPSTGMWRFPYYQDSVEIREAFFDQLSKRRSNNQQFAIMENIKYLPESALTRVRFDVDLHLADAAADLVVPHIEQFVSCLYKVLYETTTLTPDCESRIIVQRKPEPTYIEKKNDYKHGFKVTCLDLVATHTQMMQLRALMCERFEEWGEKAWLKGASTAADTDIIDDRVYTYCGWLMYGSQKKEQLAGGYVATDMWDRLDVKDSLVDLSFYELVRLLSIFAHPDEDTVTLDWIVEPPAVTVSRKRALDEAGPAAKRVRSATGSTLDPEVNDIIKEILKASVNDTTSTVDNHSRDEQIAGTYTYRLTRTDLETCPYKEQHITNGFYIHLDTTASKVYYQCLSSECKGKPRAVLKADQALVKRWVRLETSEDCICDTLPSADTASTSTPSSADTDSDFDDMLADMMEADDVPPPPTNVDLPELKHTVLRHMLNILALAPAEYIDDKKHLTAMGWLLKQGVKVLQGTKKVNDEEIAACLDEDNVLWNTELEKIWYYLCDSSKTKYSKQARDKLWEDFKTLDNDVIPPEQYIARVVSKVCEWRSETDLDFDLDFVVAIDINIIRPSVKAIKDAAEEVNTMRKAREHAQRNLDDHDTVDNKQAMDRATINWCSAVETYVLEESGANVLVKPAVYNYMSTFLTLVVSTTKTEVVQQIFQVQTAGGEKKHVMSGYHSRLKGQFIDAHGQIIELVLGWLKAVPAGSGFTMDPVFVHEKGDKRFKSCKKLPQFNTFCGFAIDAVLTPEEARNFKYDEARVKRVIDHVRMLVNGDEKVLEYLLRWIAAPLQKRGFRTNVMVINRSNAKGVGKGLFWNEFIGTLIYGGLNKERPHYRCAYDQIKDIDAVVGPFPEGLIGKVWLNMDECGIFDGATKQNEKLKGLITERTVQVNQKYLSLITYINCLNFLLTSNKQEPIKVEVGDRRFLVVDSKTKKPMSYFKNKDGTGLAAFLLDDPETVKHFYAYLMQLAMGDFHLIEPPMTDAKKISMAKHMPAEAKFMQALCLRLQELPTQEKEVYDNGTQKYNKILLADEDILTNEFIIHKTALCDAFEVYCKRYKLSSKGELVKVVKEHLRTVTKVNSQYFKGYGTGRPVVMPSVEDIQQQMKSKGLWDDAFEMDLIPSEEEQKTEKGLYWGAGLMKL